MVPKLQSCLSCEEEAICSPMHPWTSWQLCGCIFPSSVEKTQQRQLDFCPVFLISAGNAMAKVWEQNWKRSANAWWSRAANEGWGCPLSCISTWSHLPQPPLWALPSPFSSVWFDSHRKESLLISMSYPAHSHNMITISLGHVDILSHNQNVYGPSHVGHILTTTPLPTPIHSLFTHSVFNIPGNVIFHLYGGR